MRIASPISVAALSTASSSLSGEMITERDGNILSVSLKKICAPSIHLYQPKNASAAARGESSSLPILLLIKAPCDSVVAGAVGFEPTRVYTAYGFKDRCDQPLYTPPQFIPPRSLGHVVSRAYSVIRMEYRQR